MNEPTVFDPNEKKQARDRTGTETVFMRVPIEEKERAQALADKCGLSLTRFWRMLMAQAELVPMTTWRPTLRVTQRVTVELPIIDIHAIGNEEIDMEQLLSLSAADLKRTEEEAEKEFFHGSKPHWMDQR